MQRAATKEGARRTGVAVAWVAGVACLLAQALSPLGVRAEPEIELLTFGPGNSLWERFGHTAVRVHAGINDVVFSFGNAPFREPSFIWAFLRGRGQFQIVATSYGSVVERYRSYDRDMQSQRLHLPEGRASWLALTMFSQLAPPKNRYLYDQLFDNCSTRVRDLLDEASQGALSRAAAARFPGRTFRDYTLEAAAGHPIGHWGLDLVGGPNQDRSVNGFQEMYLPLSLRDRVAEALIETEQGARPLADPPRTILTRKARPARSGHDSWARWFLIAWSLSLYGLSWARGQQRSHVLARARSLALGLTAIAWGVFGSLVWTLVAVSAVPDFRWNENVFLFWPTDFALLWLLRSAGSRRRTRLLRGYLAWHGGSWLVLLVGKVAGLFPQQNGPFMAVAALSLLAMATAASERMHASGTTSER